MKIIFAIAALATFNFIFGQAYAQSANEIHHGPAKAVECYSNNISNYSGYPSKVTIFESNQNAKISVVRYSYSSVPSYEVYAEDKSLLGVCSGIIKVIKN